MQLSTKSTSVSTISTTTGHIQIAKTISLYIFLAVLGFSSSLIGSSLPFLDEFFRIQKGEKTTTIAAIYAGVVLGALSCALLYNLLSKEIIFSTAFILAGFSLVCAGVCNSLSCFAIFVFFHGFSLGSIGTAIQPYILRLWQKNAYQKSLFHGIYFVGSTGSVMAPFVLQYFLCEDKVSKEEDKYIFHVNPTYTRFYHPDSSYFFHSRSDLNRNRSDSCPFYSSSCVRAVPYTFITFGTAILLASVPYIAIWVHNYAEKNESNHSNQMSFSTIPSFVENAASSLYLKMAIYLTAFLFVIFVELQESIPVYFLSSFVVNYLKWSPVNSPFLLSAYFMSQLLARICIVILSKKIPPSTILWFNITATFVASTSVFFTINWSYIIWFASLVYGVSMATTFSTYILWMSQTIEIDAKISAMMIITSSTAGVCTPLLMGRLIHKYGQFCFAYCLIFISFYNLLAYALKTFFFHIFSDLR
ncbi:hypothetical protein HELRODRAFT_168602 [Helobdella robusta]|uniref:Major facilitator superfamily (MFS) profile domain-containing protein n=1 Tax=Helobdella robusta TaxID=6412 RepID=T1F0S4_HELRO|nr:hypothetical protein HELRODRAFT_168602 [Helobdella robusta]ESO09593.1 hypothetical protein HELRODRAFT_168602 [Helobdella robusta]